METRLVIRILTFLMSVSNLATLVFIGPTGYYAIQLLIYVPIVFLVFVVIFYFYKGRNWARILVIIGSALGLLDFLVLFTVPGIVMKMVCLWDGALAVFILYYLNTNSAKEYFTAPPGVIRKKLTAGRITGNVIIVAIAVFALAASGLIFIMNKFTSKMKSVEVFMDDTAAGTTTSLTSDGANFTPRFSPEGGRIIYSHDTGIKAEKTALSIKMLSLGNKQVFTIIDDGFNNTNPSWFPDGGHILFSSNKGGHPDLWVFSLRDGARKSITSDAAREEKPQISPDGRSIAFIQKDASGNNQVFIIPSGGGQKRALTGIDGFLRYPNFVRWVPGTQNIAYAGPLSIVIIDLEGKVLEEISLEGLNSIGGFVFDSRFPDIILLKARPPQSTTIDFGLMAIYRQNKELKELRKAAFMETDYDMSPDGTKLVYTKPAKR